MTRLRVAWKRLLRWLEPPRKLLPTRLGWFFMGGVLALGVAAVNTGNNLLYFALGMFLAAIVVSGILSERNLRGLALERVGVGTAVAGEPASFAFVVARDGSRSLPAFVLALADHDPEEGRVGPLVSFLRLDPYATRRKLYLRVFATRGVHRIPEVEVATTFPFGLFRKSRRLDLPTEVRVRPRVPEMEVPESFGGREDGASSRPVRGEGLELFGLRDHVEGDDARRIHWKASARTGRVVVKDPAREEPPQVVVRLECRGWESSDAFERAVERAAGTCAAFLREGFAVGLDAGRTRLGPSAQPAAIEAILDALVDVALGDEPAEERRGVARTPVVRVAPDAARVDGRATDGRPAVGSAA